MQAGAVYGARAEEVAAMSEDILQLPCEIYSRVVGYLRPISSWNDAKVAEFHDRKVFALPSAPQMDARIKQAPPEAVKPAFWLPEDWAP